MTLWQIVLAILVVVVFLLYLVAIPLAKQRAMKKQAAIVDQMHANLKLGDQIVLIDGIVGTIRGLDQENVRVEIADNTIINVKRMGIAGVTKEAKTDGENDLDHVHSTVASASTPH